MRCEANVVFKNVMANIKMYDLRIVFIILLL